MKINSILFISLCLYSLSSLAKRPLLTGGVSQIEGSAGGGLTPWALITGLGTRDQIGVSAFSTRARTQEFDFETQGFAIGVWNRLEISFARQHLNTLNIGSDLGLQDGFTFSLSTAGLKLRLFGDAVLEQQSWLPQISIGVQAKQAQEEDIVETLGASDSQGTDYYLSATKLLLNKSLLYNLTIRATKANQLGLLGFGSDDNDDYQIFSEVSLGYLVNRKFLVGVEYREKPDNLSFSEENAWADFFMAWQPTQNISLTVAYVQLQTIATIENQSGTYASLQVGF